jgi:MFS family permease
VLIILIGVQLISLLLFLPETQYIINEDHVISGRIGVRYWPWSKPSHFMLLVVRPLLLSYLVPLTATAIYYGMVFGFSVGLTVVAPRVLAEFYAFDTQAQGLSYLAFIIGGILGKTAGGWFGDRVVLWKQSQTGERHPEYRLWAMVCLYP